MRALQAQKEADKKRADQAMARKHGEAVEIDLEPFGVLEEDASGFEDLDEVPEVDAEVVEDEPEEVKPKRAKPPVKPSKAKAKVGKK